MIFKELNMKLVTLVGFFCVTMLAHGKAIQQNADTCTKKNNACSCFNAGKKGKCVQGEYHLDGILYTGYHCSCRDHK